jgi:alkylated DNA repair dioxygenase AlkB
VRALEPERVWLDETSWVDVQRDWIAGADEVYRTLVEQTSWRQGRIFRYERWYDEPRLGAWYGTDRYGLNRYGSELRIDGPSPAPPVLVEAHRALHAHYRTPFDGFALAYYRDGRDSVAFHRDREMRWLEDTVIAVLTFGARRPWLLRPRANRYAHEMPNHGATHDFTPGPGDLLVLGGRCQADWEHSVPKVPGLLGGRVSVQWRYTSRQGRPEVGPGYRAPRHFSRKTR